VSTKIWHASQLQSSRKDHGAVFLFLEPVLDDNEDDDCNDREKSDDRLEQEASSLVCAETVDLAVGVPREGAVEAATEGNRRNERKDGEKCHNDKEKTPSGPSIVREPGLSIVDASVLGTALHAIKAVESLSSDALQGPISRLLGCSPAMKTIPRVKTRRRVENAVLGAIRLPYCGDCQIRSGGCANGRTSVVTGDRGFLQISQIYF
jgi:hypothetical protein